MATNPFKLQISFSPAMTKSDWGVNKNPAEPAQTAGREIDLFAARNEVVGVQLRLAARQDFVLDHSNWLHALGFCLRLRLETSFPSLPAGAVECFAVGYVEGDDHRLWMEYFDRSGYAEVPAQRPQAVYIRLKIPTDAARGLHEGQVRLFSQYGFEDEILVWDGAIHLHVAAVNLPNPRDWSFHLNLWQHLTSIARFHRVPLWSEAHFELIDRYYQVLGQMGQKCVSIVATEIPWSGQRCFRDHTYPSYLFEHAVVDVSRDASGRLCFDYSKLEHLLALAARHGIDREIDIFGLVNIWQDESYGFGKVIADAPDAVRIRCYDQVSGAITYLRRADELSQFIRSLHDYFKEKDLLERVRLEADEPANLEAFKASLEFIHQAAPGFRYAVSIDHFEFMQNPPAEVRDFIPILPLLCLQPNLTERLVQQTHTHGGRMLYYVCCWPPIPNNFIHSPLVETELFGWLTYFLKVDGFERWDFCLWPADPWQRVSWRAPEWKAGDMFFVLPGKDGVPVETLRSEALRSAIQDYELLKLVEHSLPAEQASAVIAAAFKYILRTASIEDFANMDNPRPETLYSLDPQDYQAARRLLLEALEPEEQE